MLGRILIKIQNDLAKSRSTTAIVCGLKCCVIFSYRGRLINIRIEISMSCPIHSTMHLIHPWFAHPQFGSPQVSPWHPALSSKPRVMDIHGRGPEVLQHHENINQGPKFSGSRGNRLPVQPLGWVISRWSITTSIRYLYATTLQIYLKCKGDWCWADGCVYTL